MQPIPGRTEEEGPPGTVKVDFVSANPAGRWDVYADDRVICTTPCQQWVSAERPLMLRAREEAFMAAPDKVQVSNLLSHSGEGRLPLQAHSTARGQLAAGIVFTSFAGMAVLTGVTLTSVGCLAGAGSGFCTGGLITLGAGLPALAASIWLITTSMPRAEVVPFDSGTVFVVSEPWEGSEPPATDSARQSLAAPTRLVDARHAKPTLRWGPGFVHGTC